MSVVTHCTQCGRELRSPDEYAGWKVKCSDCGTINQLPGQRRCGREAERPTETKPPPPACKLCGKRIAPEADQVEDTKGNVYHKTCYEKERARRRAAHKAAQEAARRLNRTQEPVASAPGDDLLDELSGIDDPGGTGSALAQPLGMAGSSPLSAGTTLHPPAGAWQRPAFSGMGTGMRVLLGVGVAVPVLVLLFVLISMAVGPGDKLPSPVAQGEQNNGTEPSGGSSEAAPRVPANTGGGNAAPADRNDSGAGAVPRPKPDPSDPGQKPPATNADPSPGPPNAAARVTQADGKQYTDNASEGIYTEQIDAITFPEFPSYPPGLPKNEVHKGFLLAKELYARSPVSAYYKLETELFKKYTTDKQEDWILKALDQIKEPVLAVLRTHRQIAQENGDARVQFFTLVNEKGKLINRFKTDQELLTFAGRFKAVQERLATAYKANPIWDVSRVTGEFMKSHRDDYYQCYTHIAAKDGTTLLKVQATLKNISNGSDPDYAVWCGKDLFEGTSTLISHDDYYKTRTPRRLVLTSLIWVIVADQWVPVSFICKDSEGIRTTVVNLGRVMQWTTGTVMKKNQSVNIDVIFEVPEGTKQAKLLVFGTSPVDIAVK